MTGTGRVAPALSRPQAVAESPGGGSRRAPHRPRLPSPAVPRLPSAAARPVLWRRSGEEGARAGTPSVGASMAAAPGGHVDRAGVGPRRAGKGRRGGQAGLGWSLGRCSASGCGWPLPHSKNVFASQRESRDAGRTPSCWYGRRFPSLRSFSSHSPGTGRGRGWGKVAVGRAPPGEPGSPRSLAGAGVRRVRAGSAGSRRRRCCCRGRVCVCETRAGGGGVGSPYFPAPKQRLIRFSGSGSVRGSPRDLCSAALPLSPLTALRQPSPVAGEGGRVSLPRSPRRSSLGGGQTLRRCQLVRRIALSSSSVRASRPRRAVKAWGTAAWGWGRAGRGKEGSRPPQLRTADEECSVPPFCLWALWCEGQSGPQVPRFNSGGWQGGKQVKWLA